MKYTHIIEATATGTLAMAALLANAQKRKGHEVRVIYSRRPESPKDLSKFFEPGINLIQIQMCKPLEKLSCIPTLRKELKNSQPDKIFMHSSFAGFLGRLSSLLILKKTNFFYIPHCISFMRKDIGKVKRIIFVIFEWIGSIKTSSYIACSRSEQAAIRSAIPFRECHLIENALDFTPPIPTSPLPQQQQQHKKIITVGQIRPQKGPNDFAKISLDVKRNHPNAEFIWVGDGDPQLRMTLESAGVNVTGWVPKDEVWRLLLDSSVYVSTALWEGMPVSIIEAGYAGLPVVASSCTGNIDIIEHGKTGWLFNTTDEAVILIQKILENTSESRIVAKRALETAQKRFSVDRYLKQMDDLA